MPIVNVYDIYNATLEADKPHVDSVVAAMLELVETNIGNNVFVFTYQLSDEIKALPQLQRNRIVDRVLFAMRSKGIACKPAGVHIASTEEVISVPNTGPITYTPGFNSSQFDVVSFEFNIKVRKDQEYMKTWC